MIYKKILNGLILTLSFLCDITMSLKKVLLLPKKNNEKK